jgi:hypothetical protein
VYRVGGTKRNDLLLSFWLPLMSISNSYQIGSLILALAFIAVVILLVGGSPLAVVTSNPRPLTALC